MRYLIIFLLLPFISVAQCDNCKGVGNLTTMITILDRDGETERTEACIGDELIKEIKVCNIPNQKPASVLGVIAEVDSMDFQLGTLQPNQCDTFQIPFIIDTEYWINQTCQVTAMGTSMGVNVSAVATDKLIEACPIACHSWHSDGSLIQQYIKHPSNQNIPNGEAYTIERVCGGVLVETVTGNLGQNNYTSDILFLGMLFGATGDICNGCNFQVIPAIMAGCTTRIKVGGSICETESQYHETDFN